LSCAISSNVTDENANPCTVSPARLGFDGHPVYRLSFLDCFCILISTRSTSKRGWLFGRRAGTPP
jgi:hypothetical protein